MRIFVDMDGTLAKWNNVEFEELFEEGYYRNLEPNENILNEVNHLIRQGEDVYILSAYLTESDYAKKEKQEWVKQHLPQLPQEKQIFVPYGTNKAEYLKEHYSPITNQDYLIDDYTKNLLEWKEFGGIGVKYLNGINHTKATWQGLMIYEKTPHYNNTHLFNFILSEKLKDCGITMFASYDGGGPDDMSYECIYDNKYYDIYGAFWGTKQPKELTIDKIIDTIQEQIKEKKDINSTKYEDSDLLKEQYYSRHYPTIYKCDDFDILCKELPSTTLDDIEYTIYLYDETNKMPKYCETVENAVRISDKYIEWYEGLITTKDLLDDIQIEQNNDALEEDKDEIENDEDEISM